MQLPVYPHFLAALFLWQPPLEIAAIVSTRTSSTTAASNPVQNRGGNGTCEFRIINYITTTLPQQCLKNAWSAANATSVKGIADRNVDSPANITATVLNITSSVFTEASEQDSSSAMTEAEEAQIEELIRDRDNEQSTFLSFEEWKKQTLETSGQKDINSGQQKATNPKDREPEFPSSNIDSARDEREIDLDSSFVKSGMETNTWDNQPADGNEEKARSKSKKNESYRSKDAGKTCKERLSYASFDAGATVLKTHVGAKNAKNVLIENKDSYMLSECSVENKFIIIELSEDIWIDTIVLANYEFFSSMIRTFRVSVSDRYPVKMEKWKDIGTYEARNSREIQAFLIENPQIWARYIRIEFLSHYGNEYYCPLSLVRVHGTRMLESWKETEAAGEDEDSDENLEDVDGFVEEAVPEVVKEEEQINTVAANRSEEVAAARKDYSPPPPVHTIADTTSWKNPGYYIFDMGQVPPPENTCSLDEAAFRPIVSKSANPITIDPDRGIRTISKPIISPSPEMSLDGLETESIPKLNTSQPVSSIQSSLTGTSDKSASASETGRPSSSSQTGPTSSTSHKNNNHTATAVKQKTSTTTSSFPLPTIQESFFKAVSRRLTLLESNSTLSLAYISEATSHLHNAFSSFSREMTRTQLGKTTTFLNTLNSTVFSELQKLRQQYDEIWQSTVISLESQRDESRREILAVSERLNILAQEVVWQRQMSIVQSILLLFCLGLVIFSRVSTSSEPLFIRSRSRFSMQYRTDTRRYNAESQSEPGSPDQWPDVPITPDQTPNPNLSRLYENHNRSLRALEHVPINHGRFPNSSSIASPNYDPAHLEASPELSHTPSRTP